MSIHTYTYIYIERKHMAMDSRERRIKVLMLPWLAYGHISPFLELAKKLTARNFEIYFCSTPVNLSCLNTKLSPPLQNSISIKLVELQLPSFPELPPRYHTTKGLPPHLMPILMKAVDMASPNFSNILSSLKPDLLIYDFLPSWASEFASSMHIPAVALLTNGAAINSFVLHEIRNNDDGLAFPFPEVRLPIGYMKPKSSHLRESFLSQGKDWLLKYFERSNNLILIKSFRELEGKYMDYISTSLGKKVVPVGPLVEEASSCKDETCMDIIKWLDKKEKYSTIFVSFGSEIYFSKEEMEEIAYGLELSEVDFIWVVRFPGVEKMNLETALPKGFQARVREKGMVVENWAPQVKILGHSSIGGFVSHCGWGSLMESMKFGVPIIAMPMQFDQPWNARLIEEFGVGLEVKIDEDGRVFERKNLAKVIKEVVAEKSGEDIRRKARELGESTRKRGDVEMDEVVKELEQVCGM